MKSVTKVVKKYGNSGGVYVPAAWVGGKVSVELVEEPLEPEDVIKRISLEHVSGAILYGSYARNEVEEGSDIDVLIIKDGDARIDVPAELKHKCDVQAMTMGEARAAMANDPIFHKMIRDESVAIVNHQVLDSLKKEKLDANGITKRVGIAESSLGIIKEIVGAGDYQVVYPLVMRLKEMVILECLLTGKKYSTEAFRNEILRHGVSKKEFSGLMRIYRASRNKGPRGYKISEKLTEKLVSLLEAKIRHVKKAA